MSPIQRGTVTFENVCRLAYETLSSRVLLNSPVVCQFWKKRRRHDSIVSPKSQKIIVRKSY